MNKRAAAETRGRRSETLAAWALRLKGYRILARRQKTPLGEIDMVALPLFGPGRQPISRGQARADGARGALRYYCRRAGPLAQASC